MLIEECLKNQSMHRPNVGGILQRLEGTCLEADEDQMGKDKLHLMRELHAVNEELKRVQSNFEQLQVYKADPIMRHHLRVVFLFMRCHLI